MTDAPPLRFTLLPTLGVVAGRDEARRVLEEGLGFTPVSDDENSLGFHGGKLSVFVDARAGGPALPGFTPLLATNDLEAARVRFLGLGSTVEPMPWAGESDGLLVTGPGGIRFCLVSEDSVHALRHLDEGDDD